MNTKQKIRWLRQVQAVALVLLMGFAPVALFFLTGEHFPSEPQGVSLYLIFGGLGLGCAYVHVELVPLNCENRCTFGFDHLLNWLIMMVGLGVAFMAPHKVMSLSAFLGFAFGLSRNLFQARQYLSVLDPHRCEPVRLRLSALLSVSVGLAALVSFVMSQLPWQESTAVIWLGLTALFLQQLWTHLSRRKGLQSPTA